MTRTNTDEEFLKILEIRDYPRPSVTVPIGVNP